MPLYEYKCEKCGEQFEVIRGATDEEEVRCPECDEPATKLLSGFAVRSTGATKAGSCAPSGSGGG